eukprot:360923-Chlamydomonas_euryale.AAC.2
MAVCDDTHWTASKVWTPLKVWTQEHTGALLPLLDHTSSQACSVVPTGQALTCLMARIQLPGL